MISELCSYNNNLNNVLRCIESLLWFSLHKQTRKITKNHKAYKLSIIISLYREVYFYECLMNQFIIIIKSWFWSIIKINQENLDKIRP